MDSVTGAMEVMEVMPGAISVNTVMCRVTAVNKVVIFVNVKVSDLSDL